MVNAKKIMYAVIFFVCFANQKTLQYTRQIEFAIEESQSSYKKQVAALKYESMSTKSKRVEKIKVTSMASARLALSRGQYTRVRGIVTAYTHAADECGGDSSGITATGTKVKPHYTIAVKKSVIPLGSYVFIPDFAHWPNKGIFRAEDTGSGNFLVDIYVKDKRTAFKIGRKTREIYIIR